MRNKKKNKYMLLLILLLGITLGYAAISTTLKITGQATVTKQTWDVYWDTPVVNPDSVSQVVPTVTQDSGDPANTKLTWEITLHQPGDFYEFTVDAVNNGTVDAMITEFTHSVSPALPTNPEYIKYEVTYANGETPIINHLLPKRDDTTTPATPSRVKYKVRVYYDENAATRDTVNNMGTGVSYTYTLGLTYGQATDDAVARTLALGDYFIMVPDAETVTTTTSGFSGSTPTADQTLWRVIDVHQDGTIDAVSEYVSTNSIDVSEYFNAMEGLQDIASCYAKDGYTIGTRVMGYDNQTLLLSKNDYDFTVDVPPAISNPDSTTGTGEEYNGGKWGDTLYLKDYQLVSNLYKTDTATYGSNGLIAYTKAGTAKDYWLASRKYVYVGENHFKLGIRYLNSNGILAYYEENGEEYNGSRWIMKMSFSTGETGFRIRPIITLKSGIPKKLGSGTKDDPFTI